MHQLRECCTAVLPDGIRCNQPAIGGSYHCTVHNQAAKKLYLKYKKICRATDNFDIEGSSDAGYLMKCYAHLNKAFGARMTHRRFAFAPECYDDGHNYQFDLLQSQMDKCELKLKTIYEKKVDVVVEEEVVNEPDDIFVQHQVISEINSYKEERRRLEVEVNQFIDKCIADNKMAAEKKAELLEQIACRIRKLSGIDSYVYVGILFVVTMSLGRINYFDDDYVPKKCETCDCNHYAVIVLKNPFCKCGCFIKEKGKMKACLNLSDMAELEGFAGFLKKKKLGPIILDLNNFYGEHGRKIILDDYRLDFEDSLGRLCLNKATIKYRGMPSDYFAKNRVKKKLQGRKSRYRNRNDDSDEDSGGDSLYVG